MKELPGNPYDPCVAALSDSPLSDESLNEWMSHEGVTAETAIFGGIDRLTHATMALAYEQRTASIISLAALWFQATSAGDSHAALMLLRDAARRMGEEA